MTASAYMLCLAIRTGPRPLLIIWMQNGCMPLNAISVHVLPSLREFQEISYLPS